MAETWHRVWGGRENFSRTKFPFSLPTFLMTFFFVSDQVFLKKIHFSRPKFLMTVFSFSHRPGFPGFYLSFPRVYVSLLCWMSYMTLSSQENHYFRYENSFSLWHLFYSVHITFRAHPTTLLLKILGGRMHGTLLLKILGERMHGPSPPPQILGDRPLSPRPRSPPLLER